MDQLNQISNIIALSMGAAWASGINLYATILVLGILELTGNINLQPSLQILSHPAVVSAAAIMYVIEFFADKIPGIDTGWDAVHTFIRIPAGALLAVGAVGKVDPVLSLTAAILGGGLAAGSHITKAGSRILINTSPEPFSNWAASIGEDIAVVVGLWTALRHPLFFIVLLIVFILLIIWLLPRLFHAIKKIFSHIANLFKGKKAERTSGS